MSTIKQKKLARAIIDNATKDKPLNKKELVVSVGYSPVTADVKAGEIMEQKGVREALNDYGFNEDNAKQVVAEILLKKDAQDKDRLKAADMVFEVQGSKAPQRHINYNANVSVEHQNRAINAIRNIRR